MRFSAHYESPLGEMTMASDGEALTGLWFDGQKYYGAGLEPVCQECELPVFVQTKHWLDLYFRGQQPDFIPPLCMNTTDFRREVWEILQHIPYGHTMTYGEIAEQIARRGNICRMSAQAVGGAVGHNAISIIIPCHRVIGSYGSLTGYAGGIERKIALLQLEQVDMEALAW